MAALFYYHFYIPKPETFVNLTMYIILFTIILHITYYTYYILLLLYDYYIIIIYYILQL